MDAAPFAFELDEAKMQVDFNRMKQKSSDASFKSVRYRMWKCSSVKRRWSCFAPAALQPQDAFICGSDGLKLKLSDADFLANIDNNVIKTTYGITEHKMR